VFLHALLALALAAVPLAQARAQASSINSPQIVIAPNVAALNAINLTLRQGDKPGALKLAEDGVHQFPHDAQLRFVRAVVLSDLNRIDDATSAFEALCSEFPELPEPYNNLAVIRANQGKYAEAEQLLQQALQIRNTYVTARENLGDLYVAMAIGAYDQASKFDAANAVLKKKLTLAREMSDKLRGARLH
jgi:Flp pilus assembly protein TadD